MRARRALRMRRPAVALLALLVVAPALAAQDGILRGRLLFPDSSTAASGVVLEAVLVTDGAYRSRTLSGTRGDFRLRIPLAGRWRVTALRIGYQPMRLGEFHVGLRQDVVIDRPFVLTGGALTLARLAVDSAQLCGRNDESGLLVATLLAQARAALAATLLTPADGGATAEWRRFEIFTDRDWTPLSPLRIHTLASSTDRPFGSVDPQRLARDGYFWDGSDYTQFNAPDAEVLLSEQFVGSHCYRLSEPHAQYGEWVGVTFAPAEGALRRGTVGVRGTLWLDRLTMELRRVEYSYVGLRDDLEAAGARGVVEFMRLPSDVWIVSAWEMRLPRLGRLYASTGGVAVAPMDQINVKTIAGGEVASVRRGEEELYRAWSQPADRIPEVVARVGARPTCKDAPAARPGEGGILYGTVTDTAGNPVKASVRLTWTNVGRSRTTNFTEERTASAADGFYIICGITLDRPLRLTAYVGNDRVTAIVTLRVRKERPWESVALVVKSAEGNKNPGWVRDPE